MKYKLVFGVTDISRLADIGGPSLVDAFDVHELSQIVFEVSEGDLAEVVTREKVSREKSQLPPLSEIATGALQRAYIWGQIGSAMHAMHEAAAIKVFEQIEQDAQKAESITVERP